MIPPSSLGHLNWRKRYITFERSMFVCPFFPGLTFRVHSTFSVNCNTSPISWPRLTVHSMGAQS